MLERDRASNIDRYTSLILLSPYVEAYVVIRAAMDDSSASAATTRESAGGRPMTGPKKTKHWPLG
jgi:hypothetical protein